MPTAIYTTPRHPSLSGASSAGIVAAGRQTLVQEANAILAIAERLDESFARAVEILGSHRGKVIVTAVGKSGHVAQKIAATLCSTGTPAVFLHAAEAAHGDLGVYSPGDPTILISKSGSTSELMLMLQALRQLSSPIIGILGNLGAPLARSVDIVLDARVDREADALNLAPTSSSTVALALGDALAVALMHERRFTDLDFARFHPAGQLGRNLTVRVGDAMHPRDRMAVVPTDASLRDAVIAMTRYPLGAACVVDDYGILRGVVTDGDIRRVLQDHDDIRRLTVREVMTANPVTITPDVLLGVAAEVMEDRPSQLSILPVVTGEGRLAGVLRIHDVYQTSLA